MQQVECDAILAPCGLLEHLGDESRKQLTAIGQFSELEAGEVLISEGQQQDFLFIIISGQFEAATQVAGKLVRLGRLNPGDCFGEMGMLDHVPACAAVGAVMKSVVWSMNVDQFGIFLSQNNLAAAHILLAIAHALSKRLREANELIRKHNVIPEHLACRSGMSPVTYNASKQDVGGYFSIFKKGPKEYPKAQITTSIKM